MKYLTYKLKISFCLAILFFLMSPSPSFAAIQHNTPVEKEAKKKRSRKVKRIQNLRKKLTPRTNANSDAGLVLLFIGVALLIIGFFTGISLLIAGLVMANPMLWIVGLCLLGAAILIGIIGYIIYIIDLNNVTSS